METFPIIGKTPPNRRQISATALALLLVLTTGLFATSYAEKIQMDDTNTPSGYIAMLLVNETPFPGERGWISETDTKAAMLSILWVLDSRINHIPFGYRQPQIAAVKTTNILDVITAGGEKGQCDGFYRDKNGKCAAVPRIHKRIAYLTNIANQGTPGRFAQLIQYAQGLADSYISGGISEADRFAGLTIIQTIPVTGRAYSWMTGADYYHPGGNFIKIPDSDQGLLGGNRFFTLENKE